MFSEGELEDQIEFEMNEMKLQFHLDRDHADPDLNLILVKKANIRVALDVSPNAMAFSEITLDVTHSIGDGEEGPVLDRKIFTVADIVSNGGHATLDVTPAAQLWLLEPEDNLRFAVKCQGCSMDVLMKSGSSGNQLLTDLEEKPRIHRREKRSYHKRLPFRPKNEAKRKSADTECSAAGVRGKKKPRCCRKSMIVDFDELEGMDFILEPRSFDAFQCDGRCPVRSSISNNHALLKSLMHIKNRKDVKKPCCVPAKFEAPMAILHVDRKDPSKLTVAWWKDVVALQCKCT